MAELTRLVSSFFYLGKLPAGGTWGSLAGAILAWYFPEQMIAICGGVTLIGYACAYQAKRCFDCADPHAFVLDEVSGMMIGLLWAPRDIVWYLAAFGLFRFLDVRKPGFIRSLDKMDHPTCIMNDDIAAGAMVALILSGVLAILR